MVDKKRKKGLLQSGMDTLIFGRFQPAQDEDAIALIAFCTFLKLRKASGLAQRRARKMLLQMPEAFELAKMMGLLSEVEPTTLNTPSIQVTEKRAHTKKTLSFTDLMSDEETIHENTSSETDLDLNPIINKTSLFLKTAKTDISDLELNSAERDVFKKTYENLPEKLVYIGRAYMGEINKNTVEGLLNSFLTLFKRHRKLAKQLKTLIDSDDTNDAELRLIAIQQHLESTHSVKLKRLVDTMIRIHFDVPQDQTVKTYCKNVSHSFNAAQSKQFKTIISEIKKLDAKKSLLPNVSRFKKPRDFTATHDDKSGLFHFPTLG